MDEYGLTNMELKSVGYKDDQWVLASHVAQVAYFGMPKDDKRHMIVSGKERIMGADGVQSPKEYNNYVELGLFIDHPWKIKVVETCFNKTKMIHWVRNDGEKKTVGAPAPK